MSTLFNYPVIPDSSTCTVAELVPGMIVESRYGPAEILGIKVSEWNYSRKLQHRVRLRELADGHEFTDLTFPDAPLIHNTEIHFGLPLRHQFDFQRATCPMCANMEET